MIGPLRLLPDNGCNHTQTTVSVTYRDGQQTRRCDACGALVEQILYYCHDCDTIFHSAASLFGHVCRNGKLISIRPVDLAGVRVGRAEKMTITPSDRRSLIAKYARPARHSK